MTGPTVAELLEAISKSIATHDFAATAGLMRLLAVRDPDAAQAIVDLTSIVASMTGESDDRV